ncbi:tRNA-splicing endonuclease subunit Sen15 [Spea bombifrons]|uniref:tRNA-splicing endonuclease subunit Sen15 n=1 Tax=Spea bombifrons TaxID=233779 RepID=UPI00234A4AF4|nr:tRNA-splicing endonuclease subunit Sen15 [Spea bombifrons]
MDAAHGGTSSSLSTSAPDEEEPWILEHPRFREMMSLDVADSVQVYAAFLVYMDLLEARNWHDVQIFGSTELHLIYLRGQEKEDLTPQVIIPTPVSIPYSHERIQQFMKLDCTSAENQNTSSAPNILLAIVESDSTVVYYKLTDGFVIPEPPDFEDDVANKRWKKKKMRLLR